MSWRLAAEHVRSQAEAARRRADACRIDDARMSRLKAYLHAGDVQALDAWIRRREAQTLDQVANELEQRGREDVTVSERPPR